MKPIPLDRITPTRATRYPDSVRITISLPDALLENAREYAAEHRTTLSEILGDALRRQLALRSPSSAPGFPLHAVGGKLMKPNLNLDRTSQLLETDDLAQFSRE